MARLSLNELESSVRLAARGAGLPVGLGTDLAHAVSWLCRHGLDGVGAAAAALTAPALDRPAAADVQPHTVRFTDIPVAVAVAGPSALDLLVAQPGSEVVFEAVDVPLLLLGYAGVAALDHRLNVALTTATGVQVVTAEGGLVRGSAGPEVRAGVRADLGRTGPPEGAEPLPVTLNGVLVEASAYAIIRRLAAATRVPDSAASRARGAGAGLTDTD